MKLTKIVILFFSIFSFYIIDRAYSKTCYTLQIEDVDYIKKFSSLVENQNVFLVIKDEKVLFETLNKSVFIQFQDQLKKIGSCGDYKELTIQDGCYPLMSDKGSYIVSSDFVIFEDSVYRNNWSDISLALSTLLNNKQCSSLSSFQFDRDNQKKYCSLQISNVKELRCNSSCNPEIQMSYDSNSPAVDVMSVSSILFSRFEFRKLLKDIEFYVDQGLCYKPLSSNQPCEVVTLNSSRSEYEVNVPNFATYKFRSSSIVASPLSAMVELSLGGVCKDWVNKRKVIFYPLGSEHRNYFSFTIGGLKHQALGIKEFKKLFKELSQSKIIDEPVANDCQVVKNSRGHFIERNQEVIFWSDSDVAAIEAMIELAHLNLCKLN